MVLDRSGWTMFSVMELRPDSLTVLIFQLELTTVTTLKMLESDVSIQVKLSNFMIVIANILSIQQLGFVVRVTSDSKEVPLLSKDVLKFVITISGGLYVMISGEFLMLKLCADN